MLLDQFGNPIKRKIGFILDYKNLDLDDCNTTAIGTDWIQLEEENLISKKKDES